MPVHTLDVLACEPAVAPTWGKQSIRNAYPRHGDSLGLVAPQARGHDGQAEHHGPDPRICPKELSAPKTICNRWQEYQWSTDAEDQSGSIGTVVAHDAIGQDCHTNHVEKNGKWNCVGEYVGADEGDAG